MRAHPRARKRREADQAARRFRHFALTKRRLSFLTSTVGCMRGWRGRGRPPPRLAKLRPDVPRIALHEDSSLTSPMNPDTPGE